MELFDENNNFTEDSIRVTSKFGSLLKDLFNSLILEGWTIDQICYLSMCEIVNLSNVYRSLKK